MTPGYVLFLGLLAAICFSVSYVISGAIARRILEKRFK